MPIVIWGIQGQKFAFFVGPKCQKLKNFYFLFLFFATIARKSHLGSPMTKICIFLVPNYLSHAAANTAAFCNTFLPSGKAVLVRSVFAHIHAKFETKNSFRNFFIIIYAFLQGLNSWSDHGDGGY